MMRMQSWIPGNVFFLLLIALPGCFSGISGQELLKQMREGDSPLIVDVRSLKEYERGHIPGALHIPFYSILSGVNDLPAAKQDPLVLYCEHGPRAIIAGFTLLLAGYGKIFSLEGHMKGWLRNEYPVEFIVHK